MAITKEQALTATNFRQIMFFNTETKLAANGRMIAVPVGNPLPLEKSINWRATGKCKTWKTRPKEFKLPIKHGLYVYAAITHENCEMFEVVS